MMPQSCLYVGNVVHRRLRPRAHHLAYSCYWLFVDLDRLTSLDKKLRLFSLGRFNLISLRHGDHGTGSALSARAEAEDQFRRAGVDTSGARIFLLTMPRILGYGFNPISVYYCYAADGTLAALMYEVHNTFGQRHSYLMATGPASPDVHQTCDKRFYVSPFLDMGLTYDFDVAVPGERVSVAIRASDTDGALLMASLTGQRRELCDGALLKVFVTHPLLTFKVIAAIHWEALRLWWKGVPLVPRPAPPEETVTFSATPIATKAMHD